MHSTVRGNLYMFYETLYFEKNLIHHAHKIQHSNNHKNTSFGNMFLHSI